MRNQSEQLYHVERENTKTGQKVILNDPEIPLTLNEAYAFRSKMTRYEWAIDRVIYA